jgi:cell division protein FtsL
MKRITLLATVGIVAATLFGTFAMAQDAPLGDYARQTRKQKDRKPPAGKTFDNDNLPRADKLSVVGQAPAENTDAPAPATSGETATAGEDAKAAPAAGTKPADSSAGQTAEADKKPAEDEVAHKQKMYKEWQTKIQAQQTEIDNLARELDLTNREYRLRAAAFYADAGNRLRNAESWDKEDSQFKEQIADKQKKLDDAKKQLEDLQQQARKAGVPSSMRE